MLRNSFNREFIEDPFFAAHRNHMMSMGPMFQMHSPFVQPQIQDSRMAERERRTRERRHQQQLQLPTTSPFNMMSIGLGGMLSSMDSMMSDMHRRFEQPTPTSPVGSGSNFVQSSFVSYSNTGNGAPKVYQSSLSQHARGGVIETKKTERDSTSGVEKVVIGHRIGDREHKIERQRNNRTGQNDVNQEFVNIDEEEAEDFDKEFQDKVRQPMPVRGGGSEHPRRHRVNPTDNHSHSHNHSGYSRAQRQIMVPRNRSYRDRY